MKRLLLVATALFTVASLSTPVGGAMSLSLFKPRKRWGPTTTTTTPPTTAAPTTTSSTAPPTTTTAAPATTTTAPTAATAPATTTAPAPATAPASRPGFVTRRGGTLYLDERPYRFTGVTAYQLATLWSVNWGCGGQVNDLDAFFNALRPHSMVKISAFQAMAFNNRTSFAIDFTALDRVVRAAERTGQKLIMSLSVQMGDCDDGHWKGKAWYDGGYRQSFDDDGRNLSRLSFVEWMRLVVPRYKDSPAIGMWQLVGEPEASDCAPGYAGNGCYGRLSCSSGATASLRAFFDTVGGELKRLDPNHLLGTGTLSRLQCGWNGGGYRHVLASPAVDVANFHDYGNDTIALPADLAGAMEDARAVSKPFVMDEAGMAANATGTGCMTTARRSELMRAKMDAGFAAGMSGFVAWNWEQSTDGACNMNILPSDPLMSVVRGFQP